MPTVVNEHHEIDELPIMLYVPKNGRHALVFKCGLVIYVDPIQNLDNAPENGRVWRYRFADHAYFCYEAVISHKSAHPTAAIVAPIKMPRIKEA